MNTKKKLRIWGLLPVLGICSAAVLLVSLSAFASYVQEESFLKKSAQNSTQSTDFNSEKEKHTSLIKVKDTNETWESVQEIDIFQSSEYGNKGIIAPGTGGSYGFQIENIMDNRILYQLSIEEDKDTDQVHMEYRLKHQNVYILGNEEVWADALELKTKKIELAAGKMEDFRLEWRWIFEGDRDLVDTVAGKEATEGIGNYLVHILILAENEEPTTTTPPTEEPPTEIPSTEVPPTEKPSTEQPQTKQTDSKKQYPPVQNQTNSSQVSAAKTGDESAVMTYALLFLCASGVFIISITSRRLKR